MLRKIQEMPRYVIVACSVVAISLSALVIHGEWRSHRLKQLLIPTSEFEDFLSDAESQRQLNEYYDDMLNQRTSSTVADNNPVESITVTDSGIRFEKDYVFPDGFFKGLTVDEALAKLPEIDAQITEWNAQIEEDMIQFEKDKREMDVMVEQAYADLDSINKMLKQW